MHGRVQDRARDPARPVPDLGQVRRLRHVPRLDPRLRGDALQPLHRRPMREDLPDARVDQARRRHRRLRQGQLHRLQVLHAGLPLRRDLHRRRDQHRRQVQLLRPPRRRGARARMRHGVPDALDLGRRPRRRGVGHLPADPGQPGGGAGARAAHRPERLLPRRGQGDARPAGRARAGHVPVGPRRRATGGHRRGLRRRRPHRAHDVEHRAPEAVGLAGDHVPVGQGAGWRRAVRGRARRAAGRVARRDR